jgi:chitinase
MPLTRNHTYYHQAYDFAGSWDKNTGHLANINPSVACPACTPFNAHSVIQAYIHNGVPCDKIVLGMPLYGRVFQQTSGMGKPFTGIGSSNEAEYSFEAGVYDFKALPRAGATEHVDEDVMASYSFNPATGELISYDNVEIARRKAEYIRDNGLGGAMWWELSGDRKIGDGSLVEAVSLPFLFILF